MSVTIKYSLKVWLTSVAVAPLLVLFIMSCQQYAVYYMDFQQSFSSIIICYVPFVLIEFILSLITWLLFMVVIKVTVTYLSSQFVMKLIIFFAGIILTIATFLVILSPEDIFNADNAFPQILYCNCFCIGWCTLYYDLNPADQ
jgi:hypothetical protein